MASQLQKISFYVVFGELRTVFVALKFKNLWVAAL